MPGSFECHSIYIFIQEDKEPSIDSVLIFTQLQSQKLRNSISGHFFRWEGIQRMALNDCLLLNLEVDHFVHCNISNHSVELPMNDDWFHPGILYVIPAIYGVIILIGLIGNITLIKIFCTVKSMRNVPNLFISSLALGDLLLLVTCAPVDASRYLADKWLFGRIGCKLIPFIQLTSVGVSVFTLTALSADR